MHVPAARGAIARLDDRVGNGRINPKKKWWLDIEMLAGRPAEPRHGVNRRDLDPVAARAGTRPTPSSHPRRRRAGGPRAFRADRKAGLAAAREAETPEAARARRSS